MKSDNNTNRYDELPNYLLLQKESIRKIADNYIKDTKKAEIIAAIFNIIIDCFVSWMLSSSPNVFKSTIVRILFIVSVAIAIGVVTVIVLSKYKESKMPLEKTISMIAEKESECTGIFIISHKNTPSQNEVMYLTQSYKTTNIPFLVYLHKFIEYREKENNGWDELKIKNKLGLKLGINASLIKIDPIGSNSSIKTLLEDHPKLRIFHYFHVQILMPYSNFLRLSPRASFKSLQELKNNNESQKYNYDVVKFLSDNALSIVDESFTPHPVSSLKIIWNITNTCSFNCNICATHSEASDRQELTLEEKKNVLHNILKYGCDQIKEIDFSGGDPFQQTDSISIISDAIRILGNERVCVTTTGKGLEQAFQKSTEIDLFYKCEITIDDTMDGGEYERFANKDYIIQNTTALKNYLSRISHLTINVPIINPKLSREHIKELVESIATINNDNKVTVNLIRLMPVGAATPTTGSSHYKEDPSSFVKTFVEFAGNYGITCRLQCALRGKIKGDHCNMFEEKIGIDCAGNVFACAWGGYVRKKDGNEYSPISENPFYLGNLKETDLLSILRSSKAHVIRNRIAKQTSHCRIYNCICSDNNEFTIDCDPLFK